MNGWLERFGVLDAQEEEAIDQSPEYSALWREQTPNPERRSYRYRALLGEQAHTPAGADASAAIKQQNRTTASCPSSLATPAHCSD
jgi:hypothetical protein